MFAESKTIYCIGIGGIGVSGLARLLKADGHTVSGSDGTESMLTQQLVEEGIEVAYTQDGSAMPETADLVIFSAAVPEDHPERMFAAERGIKQLNYFEAVGEYAKQFEKVIAIAGTHGKSTTTAMLANTMVAGGLNPTVIVGSQVREFAEPGDARGRNARSGSKEYFVIEACEYKEHFLELKPDIAVITNIEADHLDYYDDVDQIIVAFQKFIDGMSEDGTVVMNADDERTMRLVCGGRKQVTCGFADGATVQARYLEIKQQAQSMVVDEQTFVLDIPGDFNVSNALGAISVARELGVDDQVTAEALAAFSGVWRRFEVLGMYRKAVIISDYAHHPTEIRKTIHATRGFYPDRRIVVVFQPHQRRRTQELFDDFVDALSTADLLILEEIFDVAGREEELEVSSQQLVDAIEARGVFPLYSPNHEVTLDMIDDVIEKKDVVLLMGAGDIYTLAQEFENDAK